MNEQLGTDFVTALVAKDADAMKRLLAPDVSFRAMTPSKFWETRSAEEVVDDIILGAWFDDGDHIDALESVETGTVVDRHRVGYRVRVTNKDGTSLVEQQAYYAVKDERIVWLRVMCAGYRPV